MEKVVIEINQKQQKSDFHYWQKQSYQNRLEALEQIRQEYHKYQYNAEPRLQRFYTIIKAYKTSLRFGENSQIDL